MAALYRAQLPIGMLRSGDFVGGALALKAAAAAANRYPVWADPDGCLITVTRYLFDAMS
ncbi:hypothetical protein ACSHWB_26190 [Lentzea sp. HUAS TT2]|uniref:hypothetical protein n=1 Tax=Lentzea sp. HUAS TT2 TaxID=3447454 RepID=UPI003F72A733